MAAITDSTLPITPLLPDLARALREGPAAILQAPPGAGKSTAVAPALLEQPWLHGRKILLLEPRRLAARNVARFMAEQRGEALGDTIGYRMRFESRIGARTRIEVITEGVLSRLLQQDPSLASAGLVIFDEFHERSLQADLALALCLDSQAGLRPDLHLLVMSATLEKSSLAALLGHAPVLHSEGRSFPVEVHYRPPRNRWPRNRHGFLAELASTVRTVLDREPGSVLVFLPGVGEIQQLVRLLQAQGLPEGVDLAPLYGELELAAQQRAIAPSPPGRRKLVLATSIAETSLTIEGIRIVIDSGLMRVPRFDPRTGMTRLETVAISQSSAAQRSGRAGRLEPGVCYRLWSESEQAGLVAFGRPEILEADLAPVALELAQWGVGPDALRWLDPPPAAAYDQARELLQSLDALDRHGRITAHGQAMAELGLHPRLAHMVLRGAELGAGDLGCDIAALLGERDIIPRGDPDRDSDVRTRLQRLHADRDGGSSRIKRAASQCRQRLRAQGRTGDRREAIGADAVGLLLALAYPDRIGQRRGAGPGRFLLANGRGAQFAGPESLAACEYIVAAHLDGSGRDARVQLAAQVQRTSLLAHFADRIVVRDSVDWDERQQAVVARRQWCLGNLVLDEQPLGDADPARAAALLTDALRRVGLDRLPWDARSRAWRSRVAFLHRLAPEQWPDVSDAALLASLDRWLTPYLGNMTRLDHLRRLNLQQVLAAQLDWQQQRRLDELAPTHVAVPSGSRIALDYSGDVPVLAVRLQEMFGAQQTPRVADGQVALLVHLLSPAGRPVQVTQDLAGFWRNGYFDVRKDLRGRYPKHAWPDNPLTAQPSRHAKRRS